MLTLSTEPHNRYFSGGGGLVGTADDYGRFACMLGRRVRDPERFGWAGAFGTQSFIDPVENMVGLMLIQREPTTIDNEARTLWPRVRATAYQALED